MQRLDRLPRLRQLCGCTGPRQHEPSPRRYDDRSGRNDVLPCVTIPPKHPASNPAPPSFNHGNSVIRVSLYLKNGKLIAGRLAGGGKMATINRDGSIDAKFGWWRAGSGKIKKSADGVSTLPRRRSALMSPTATRPGSKRLASRSQPPAAGESPADTSNRRSASRCW